MGYQYHFIILYLFFLLEIYFKIVLTRFLQKKKESKIRINFYFLCLSKKEKQSNCTVSYNNVNSTGVFHMLCFIYLDLYVCILQICFFYFIFYSLYNITVHFDRTEKLCNEIIIIILF